MAITLQSPVQNGKMDENMAIICMGHHHTSCGQKSCRGPTTKPKRTFCQMVFNPDMSCSNVFIVVFILGIFSREIRSQMVSGPLFLCDLSQTKESHPPQPSNALGSQQSSKAHRGRRQRTSAGNQTAPALTRHWRAVQSKSTSSVFRAPYKNRINVDPSSALVHKTEKIHSGNVDQSLSIISVQRSACLAKNTKNTHAPWRPAHPIGLPSASRCPPSGRRSPRRLHRRTIGRLIVAGGHHGEAPGGEHSDRSGFFTELDLLGGSGGKQTCEFGHKQGLAKFGHSDILSRSWVMVFRLAGSGRPSGQQIVKQNGVLLEQYWSVVCAPIVRHTNWIKLAEHPRSRIMIDPLNSSILVAVSFHFVQPSIYMVIYILYVAYGYICIHVCCYVSFRKHAGECVGCRPTMNHSRRDDSVGRDVDETVHWSPVDNSKDEFYQESHGVGWYLVNLVPSSEWM